MNPGAGIVPLFGLRTDPIRDHSGNSDCGHRMSAECDFIQYVKNALIGKRDAWYNIGAIAGIAYR